MEIFKLCGFEIIEKQFFSAFNFIRDYDVIMNNEVETWHMWESENLLMDAS